MTDPFSDGWTVERRRSRPRTDLLLADDLSTTPSPLPRLSVASVDGSSTTLDFSTADSKSMTMRSLRRESLDADAVLVRSVGRDDRLASASAAGGKSYDERVASFDRLRKSTSRSFTSASVDVATSRKDDSRSSFTSLSIDPLLLGESGGRADVFRPTTESPPHAADSSGGSVDLGDSLDDELFMMDDVGSSAGAFGAATGAAGSAYPARRRSSGSRHLLGVGTPSKLAFVLPSDSLSPAGSEASGRGRGFSSDSAGSYSPASPAASSRLFGVVGSPRSPASPASSGSASLSSSTIRAPSSSARWKKERDALRAAGSDAIVPVPPSLTRRTLMAGASSFTPSPDGARFASMRLSSASYTPSSSSYTPAATSGDDASSPTHARGPLSPSSASSSYSPAGTAAAAAAAAAATVFSPTSASARELPSSSSSSSLSHARDELLVGTEEEELAASLSPRRSRYRGGLSYLRTSRSSGSGSGSGRAGDGSVGSAGSTAGSDRVLSDEALAHRSSASAERMLEGLGRRRVSEPQRTPIPPRYRGQKVGGISASQKALNLFVAGNSYDQATDYVNAIKIFKRMLKVTCQLGDVEGQALAHNRLAVCFHAMGGRENLRSAVTFHRSHWEVASTSFQRIIAQCNEGLAHVALGSTRTAVACFSTAAKLLMADCRAEGSSASLCSSLGLEGIPMTLETAEQELWMSFKVKQHTSSPESKPLERQRTLRLQGVLSRVRGGSDESSSGGGGGGGGEDVAMPAPSSPSSSRSGWKGLFTFSGRKMPSASTSADEEDGKSSPRASRRGRSRLTSLLPG